MAALLVSPRGRYIYRHGYSHRRRLARRRALAANHRKHPQHGAASMPTDRLVPGLKAEIVMTVDDKLVVRHMGGEGVLSTPAMIGLMERAGIEAVQAHLARRAHHRRLRGQRQALRRHAERQEGHGTRRTARKSMVASSASRSRRTTRTRRSAMAPIAARIVAPAPWLSLPAQRARYPQ